MPAGRTKSTTANKVPNCNGSIPLKGDQQRNNMSLHCEILQIFHMLSVHVLFGTAHCNQTGHIIMVFHTYLEVYHCICLLKY